MERNKDKFKSGKEKVNMGEREGKKKKELWERRKKK